MKECLVIGIMFIILAILTVLGEKRSEDKWKRGN